MFALIIVGALTSDNFFSMDNILNVLAPHHGPTACWPWPVR